MGFKVGGIRIIIYGNDFYVGFEFQVLVNDIDFCMELMCIDISIVCIMFEGVLLVLVFVCVCFECWGCVYGNFIFWYMQNLVIMVISFCCSFVSGGRIIIVVGECFYMVQNVFMVVYYIGWEFMFCKVFNFIFIICLFFGVLSNVLVLVDFFINGWVYVDEVVVVEELLDFEEVQWGSRFCLDYFFNLQFFMVKREKWIKYYFGEFFIFVIYKEQDSLGFQSYEYWVKIG